MLHSCEIRWFFLGVIPEEAKNWFEASDDQEEESRGDVYLVFPGCEATGIKLRNGAKFEIKARRSGPKTIEPVKGVVGRADCWVRWSPDFELTGELKRAMTEGYHWIEVDKTRWLRRYQIKDGARPSEIAKKDAPLQGCNVELAELQVESGVWYTIGFEAFGPAKSVDDHLRATVEDFFSSRPGEVPKYFSDANSMSYPAWFATVGLG
jgi:hypothetical protein